MLVFQLGYSRGHKRKQLNVDGKRIVTKEMGFLLGSGKLSLYTLNYHAHLAPGTVLAVDNENP